MTDRDSLSDKHEQLNSKNAQASHTPLTDARSAQGTYHAQADAAGVPGYDTEGSDAAISETSTKPGFEETEASWYMRAVLIMVLDVIVVAASFFFSLLVRFDFMFSRIPDWCISGYLSLMPFTILLVLGTLWAMRLYHSIWKFASLHELLRLIGAWAIDVAVLAIFAYVTGTNMPDAYWVVGGLFGLISTAGVRFSYRLARLLRHELSRTAAKRTLII
jgi:hypothetical protein